MKKYLLLVMITMLVVGCGQQKAKMDKKETDYHARGMKFLEQADVTRAIQNFDMAIKQDPTNSDNFLTLGHVYFRLKNYDQAADTFQAATRVDPGNGDAYYFLSLSRGAQQGDRKAEALKAAQMSAEIFMKKQNKEKLARSLILVKSLTDVKVGQE